MIDYVKTEIGKFSDEKFGIRTNPAGPLNHLKEEVRELLDAIGKENEEEEWADCLLLLIDAFRIRYGTDTHTEKLLKFSIDKLYKLYEREWEEDPDTKGVFRHKE